MTILSYYKYVKLKLIAAALISNLQEFLMTPVNLDYIWAQGNYWTVNGEVNEEEQENNTAVLRDWWISKELVEEEAEAAWQP